MAIVVLLGFHKRFFTDFSKGSSSGIFADIFHSQGLVTKHDYSLKSLKKLKKTPFSMKILMSLLGVVIMVHNKFILQLHLGPVHLQSFFGKIANSAKNSLLFR